MYHVLDFDAFRNGSSAISLTHLPHLAEIGMYIDANSARSSEETVISTALDSLFFSWIHSTERQQITVGFNQMGLIKRAEFSKILGLVARMLEAVCVSWVKPSNGSDTGARVHRTTRAAVSVKIYLHDISTMEQWWKDEINRSFPGFQALDCLDIQYLTSMCVRFSLLRYSLISALIASDDNVGNWWQPDESGTTSSLEGSPRVAVVSAVGPRS